MTTTRALHGDDYWTSPAYPGVRVPLRSRGWLSSDEQAQISEVADAWKANGAIAFAESLPAGTVVTVQGEMGVSAMGGLHDDSQPKYRRMTDAEIAARARRQEAERLKRRMVRRWYSVGMACQMAAVALGLLGSWYGLVLVFLGAWSIMTPILLHDDITRWRLWHPRQARQMDRWAPMVRRFEAGDLDWWKEEGSA